MIARIGIVGMALLISCRAPARDRGGANGVTFDSSGRTPVQVVVTSTDEDLRSLVAASLNLQLRQASHVAPAIEEGRLRLQVNVEAQPKAAGVHERSAVLVICVVNPEGSGAGWTDGQGQPTDSILGGTVTCDFDQLWSTCSNIVTDVDRFARLEEDRLRAMLRAGETDLVDDDFIRQGEK